MARRSTVALSRADVSHITSEQGGDLTIFEFETDFAGSMRCIPMAVRFKLDHCGIKLSLRQWSRFSYDDRLLLFHCACESPEDIRRYRTALISLIETRARKAAKDIAVEPAPVWADTGRVADVVRNYARALDLEPPTLRQWAALTALQRFTLVKLTREGHDNENFVPAMREFGVLVREETLA
ncbi:nitrate reductase associated protein [Chelatococcus asaccharovorans]|uniref:nitrate reductase associated protein n=1 Tax=Chelatococcus asaccharovorans TaxID=28210 RepID=UPI00224C7355|nr:nitrate reductase associated protein [Chelatococcus asaccharovorans]CAH1661735.1 conserved hypothetical protein [Chelatococcus asaccharovorans]CAH1689519.1 conserved hypothetical protein [Chelatococcus asaccharovorans]